MTWLVALRALFDGMIQGVFTGRELAPYISAKVDDPVNARRIINGTDKAALVAGYHLHLLTAIEAASGVTPAVPRTVRRSLSQSRPAVAVTSASPVPAQGFWARLTSALIRKAA